MKAIPATYNLLFEVAYEKIFSPQTLDDLKNKSREQARTIFAQIFKKAFKLMGYHAKGFTLLQEECYKT